MPSVFYPPQSFVHTVVPRSRRSAAVFALLLAFASWPRPALAAPPDPAEASPAQAKPTYLPREESYRGALTLSYVLAPFLALGFGSLLSGGDADDGVAAFGAGSMLLAPAVVHMSHGKVLHGPLSFLGLASSTTVGTLLGGLIGFNLDSLDCDPAEDSDGCDFAGLNGLVVGALLGGVVGYTGFAIYDVTANGALVLDEAPPPDRAALQLWLSPLPAAKNERAEAAAPFGGLLIGASLQM
jgi:hypothetical protein